MCNSSVSISSQAAELAEFTAKIALLEEAKRKKDDEATEWQHKVQDSSYTSPQRLTFYFKTTNGVTC